MLQIEGPELLPDTKDKTEKDLIKEWIKIETEILHVDQKRAEEEVSKSVAFEKLIAEVS